MRPDRGQFVIASLRRATCRVFERANYTSSLSLSLSLLQLLISRVQSVDRAIEGQVRFTPLQRRRLNRGRSQISVFCLFCGVGEFFATKCELRYPR